jgi:hypothetical protein
MALSLVIMPIQAKLNFHPLGEKARSRELRNKQHPQDFQLVNLWFEVLRSSVAGPAKLTALGFLNSLAVWS